MSIQAKSVSAIESQLIIQHILICKKAIFVQYYTVKELISTT